MEKSSDMNGETRWINDDMEVDIELDKKHETEILRIISQYLIEKGLNESAKTLQHETGVDLEGEAIQNFRSLVLEGKFDEVIRLIYEIEYDTESISRVKLAIYEQKYLELVEKRDTVNALAWLRNELIQSTKQIEEYDNYKGRKSLTKEKIKILSSIIMCKNLNEIQNFIDWDGAEGSSRKRLLDELQSYISPQKMLESGRLETLLKQSIAYQINSWKFHDWKQKDYSYSFLEKHKCDKIPLPSKYLNSIQAHNDEIWYLSISPNGARLASAGRDKLINIWDLKWNGETLEIKLITCI